MYSFLLAMRAFFLGVVIVATYFSYYAAQGALLYLRTESRKPASSVEFNVVEGSWGRYYLEGSFVFNFKNAKYEGHTRLSEPVFLNRLVAEEKALVAKEKQWTVYFDATNPKWSTLERTIPFKEIVYALLSWISLGYFIGLVRKLKKQV